MCYYGKPNFPIEYPDYNHEDLNKHHKLEHVQCDLCLTGKFYFDSAALFKHCEQAHVQCRLCAPREPGEVTFAQNESRLVAHKYEAHPEPEGTDHTRPQSSKLEKVSFGAMDKLRAAASSSPSKIYEIEAWEEHFYKLSPAPEVGQEGQTGQQPPMESTIGPAQEDVTVDEMTISGPAAIYLNLGRAARRNFKKLV